MIAAAVVLPSDIAGHDQVMGCQAEHPMPNLFSTDTVRDASVSRPASCVVLPLQDRRNSSASGASSKRC